MGNVMIKHQIWGYFQGKFGDPEYDHHGQPWAYPSICVPQNPVVQREMSWG